MTQFIQTTAERKIWQLSKRVRAISGGTGASKTISILIWLISYAQKAKNEVISVTSETLPHLKRGAVRDFINILQEYNIYEDERWNRTDYIYTFRSGSIIEFFSSDQWHKVRGPRRDILFINEANNIPYETYNQLEIRTKKVILMDWNPVSEFWFYTDVQPYVDADFITLTYKDNEALDENIVASIESRKWNKNWFKIYGLGELGELQGKIYTDWRLINGIPLAAKLLRYGLDFGYTNDPTAIVAIYKFNDWLILDEVCYNTGLSNKQIANILLGVPKALTRADSAEPKSIDEIRSYGVSIIASAKGPGSVLAGIQYLQGKHIAVTKRSTNLIKEYRNYMWITDNNGKTLNEPSQIWNHCMDALRYGVDDLRITEARLGSGVKMAPKTEPPKIWTASQTGAIKGPDFATAFKQALKQRKSTSGAEFWSGKK